MPSGLVHYSIFNQQILGMNYNGPKVRLSRRLGLALTPKAEKYLQRKPHPPGQHGVNTRRRKTSDYAKQLLEKQRLRFQYNISERQLRTTYDQAKRKAGNTGDLMVQFLESRLDAVVLRSGLARTIYASRQYVTHGHFTVNGKRVDLPSYRVRPGDIIAVRAKSRKLEFFHTALGASMQPPPYLEVSKANMSTRLLHTPMREDIPIICNIPLVVEYYSR